LLRSPTAVALLEEVDSQGGWRGLFDPYSEEWRWSPLGVKVRLLEGFERAGFPRTLLLRMLKQLYARQGRQDLAASCDEALARLVAKRDDPSPAAWRPQGHTTGRRWRVDRRPGLRGRGMRRSRSYRPPRRVDWL
jgi:hypothetical protein